ncbi:MAG: hypothetical protein WDW38_000269 [Sanguina aurantia]
MPRYPTNTRQHPHAAGALVAKEQRFDLTTATGMGVQSWGQCLLGDPSWSKPSVGQSWKDGELSLKMVRYAALDVLIPKLAYDSLAAGENLAGLPPARLRAVRDALRQQQLLRSRIRRAGVPSLRRPEGSSNQSFRRGLVNVSSIGKKLVHMAPRSGSPSFAGQERLGLARGDRREQRFQEPMGGYRASRGESDHAEDAAWDGDDEAEGREERGGSLPWDDRLENTRMQGRRRRGEAGQRDGEGLRISRQPAQAREPPAAVQTDQEAAIVIAVRQAGRLFDAAFTDAINADEGGEEGLVNGAAAELAAERAAAAVAAVFSGRPEGWASEVRDGRVLWKKKRAAVLGEDDTRPLEPTGPLQPSTQPHCADGVAHSHMATTHWRSMASRLAAQQAEQAAQLADQQRAMAESLVSQRRGMAERLESQLREFAEDLARRQREEADDLARQQRQSAVDELSRQRRAREMVSGEGGSFEQQQQLHEDEAEMRLLLQRQEDAARRLASQQQEFARQEERQQRDFARQLEFQQRTVADQLASQQRLLAMELASQQRAQAAQLMEAQQLGMFGA